MTIQNITSFDPSKAVSGTIVNSLGGGSGTFVVYNDSPVTLRFQYETYNKEIVASTVDILDLRDGSNNIYWTVVATMSNSAAYPISNCTIEGYSGSLIGNRRYPFAIQRVLNY